MTRLANPLTPRPIGAKIGGMLRPLRGLVVVRIDPDPVISPGGIHLAKIIERPKALRGTVLAVGPGDWTPKDERAPMLVDVGDRVLVRRSAGFVELRDDDGREHLRHQSVEHQPGRAGHV